MPMQAIKGGVWLPEPAVIPPNGFTALQIDASGEKVAFIVKAPKGGSIRRIGVRTGTVTTGATLDARIEVVDGATGEPSGMLWGTGTRGDLIIGSTDDNTWKFSANLDADASVQADDIFAVVFVYGTSANLNLTASGLAVNATAEFPYTAHFTSSWSKASYSPIVGLEYSDGSFAVSPGVYPVSDANGTNIAVPTEIALRFKLAFPARIAGFWLWAQFLSTTDARVQLYKEGNNLPLTSVTIDGGITSIVPSYLRSEGFSSPVTLQAGVVYRMSVLPTAGSVAQLWFNVQSAAVMDAFAGGQEFFWSQRTRSSTTDPDNAAWTDTTTKRPLLGLILDQFSDENLGYFDVTAFGAVGDGMADDTTKIQAAINAASAAGSGSTVFVPRGTYLCDLLTIPNTTDGIRFIGDGTLKLRTGSQAVLLRVVASHCEIAGIRIDGNRGLTFTGTGHGLEVTGSYNLIHDVTVFNTRAFSLSAGVNITGQHNLVRNTWCYDNGGVAFRDFGNYNRFQDCTAQNWGFAGFRRISGDYDRLDLDGFEFAPGSDSTGDNCLLFDATSGMGKMVAIRNTIVDWQVTPSGSPSVAKFARIERLILDNCLFKHKQTLVDVEIGASVKRVYLDHTFLSRQMKLATIDSDAMIMLLDTQIGDEQLWASPNNQPTVSVEGIAGAQFIARASRFIGYTSAALQVTVNLQSEPTKLVHLEASDTEFQGHGDNVTTYDVTVSGSGAVNASRRLLWLNNRPSNSGLGNAFQAIANANQQLLFTTRDWSKKVLETNSTPPASSSDVTWTIGDTFMHTTPTFPNGFVGWVFTASGWKTFGAIV